MTAAAPLDPTNALPASAPPLPGRVILRQRWVDLVFLHWRVGAADVAPFLPLGTRPDEFDGSSWVGLIPFVLADTTFPPLPPLSRVGTFVEVNVRLYARDVHGRRGVVFRTLEASRLPPVLAANAAFGLPYRWASAHVDRRVEDDDVVLDYRSRRRFKGPATRIRARRTAPLSAEAPDAELARFLTARWGYHERHLGRTWWARNDHEPWPLHRAELELLDDELLAASGFTGLADRAPDSVLSSPGVATAFSRPRVLAPLPQ